MITADGKCDGKCTTCNLIQQAYCRLVQFQTEQDGKLVERLDRIEKSLATLNSELIIAQRGDGAEKVAENSINI